MLRTRVMTAIVLALVVGGLLFKASEAVWLGFVVLVALIAAWEWIGFSSLSGNKVARALMAMIPAGLVFVFYDQINDTFLAFLVMIQLFSALFFVSRFEREKGARPQEKDGVVLIIGLLNIFVFSLVFIVFRETFSAGLLLLTMMVIWAVDSGAYFSGRRFGKNKLAPFSSPNKTWEGVYGGVLLAFIVSWLGISYLSIELTVPTWLAALALTFIGFLSVLGDLFESVLKRQSGVKDSGWILPGHGGVLDRLDSLILSLPLFYLCWLGVVA